MEGIADRRWSKCRNVCRLCKRV